MVYREIEREREYVIVVGSNPGKGKNLLISD